MYVLGAPILQVLPGRVECALSTDASLQLLIKILKFKIVNSISAIVLGDP